jgi:glycerol kinase
MTVLVIDVGTSGVRAAAVRPDASVALERHRPLLPETPAPGLVEFDAAALAEASVSLAAEVLAEAGPVEAVGITNQRASTVVWDRATGTPVGPALGWQDLRTVGDCLVLQGQGIHVPPNASATKLAHLLDAVDPGRERDLCFGTVDTWLAWTLSQGALHVTDATNAAVTGLLHADGHGWSEAMLDALRIPAGCLPDVHDTSGIVGEASLLDGAPPIAALCGDQQASLVGQGCVAAGQAKITFGTGGMLDLNLGTDRAPFERQGGQGCFPIIAWRQGGTTVWGVEAVMLSAGTNVEWLRDDLGLIATAAASHDIASACEDTGGVVYVPALLGLGAPRWDHGARGALLGLTRGSGRPEVVRAVLEGVAQRGADLLDAAEADSGLDVPALRVDGGMSDNPTFTQALADATQRPVEVSPVVEATTIGAAFLAGLAVGTWGGWDDIAASWQPRAVLEPGAPLDRERWRSACDRAAGWIPELTALRF